MKHDKKPENDLKRLTMLAAGTAASVAVLAGGVRVWNGYQNGSLFHPDLFVSTHDYQENQIMFPEKNDYGQPSQTDTSDDNHRPRRMIPTEGITRKLPAIRCRRTDMSRRTLKTPAIFWSVRRLLICRLAGICRRELRILRR